MQTMQFTFDDAPVEYSSEEASAWAQGATHGASKTRDAIVQFFSSTGRHAEAAEIEANFKID